MNKNLRMVDDLLLKPLGSFIFGSRGQAGRKLGLPPGTLVHVGEKSSEPVRINRFEYAPGYCRESRDIPADECRPREAAGIKWIDVVGLHDTTVIEKLGNNFGVHALTLEDVLNTRQRPKIEQFDNYVYIVVKMLMLDAPAKTLVVEQVSLVVGDGFVVSFQERPGDVFDNIRQRIRADKGRVRKAGADYLAYLLLDAIVDHYSDDDCDGLYPADFHRGLVRHEFRVHAGIALPLVVSGGAVADDGAGNRYAGVFSP